MKNLTEMKVLAGLLVVATAVCAVSTVTQGDTVTRSIMTQENDAEEHQNSGRPDAPGAMDITSSDLELFSEGGSGLNWQVIGVQYNSLGIPQGSTINSATIQFTVDTAGNAGDNNATIYAEATDNSAVFAATAFNITGRARTTAAVAWAPALNNNVGTPVVTPNLASIIQEVVNRPGWAPNNMLTIMLFPNAYLASPSGGTTAIQEIECEAFPDDSGLAWNDTATLTVDFTPPGPGGEGEGEGEVTLFSDDFARPDGATVGNGWVETDNPTGTPATSITLAGGALTFADASDAVRLPAVQHAFTNTSSGQLVWTFDMSFARTGNEGTYAMYMQLGDSATMTGADIDAGVGVNLVWTAIPAGTHEKLGSRVGGTNTALATVTGPNTITVTANLDTKTYNVSVGANQVGTNIAFANNVSLNTVRFFADGFNEANFGGRTFDNVSVKVPGSSGGEGEGEPQGNVILSNVYPPFIDAGSMVILTAPPGSGWQWSKDGAPISGATDRELAFNPVQTSDVGSYTVEYNDGTSPQVTPAFVLEVSPEGSVPVAGGLALAALLGACALGGASALRRRK